MQLVFCYNEQMKWIASVVLIAALLVAGNYWYASMGLVCKLPVSYSIGDIDERFDLSEADVLAAATKAENIWEEALEDKNIFNYEEGASLQINFIYDERQANADAASQVLEDLDTRGEANEVLVELHGQLLKEYEGYEEEYQTKRQQYEEKLDAYNEKVEKYNSSGGAPPEVYEELEKERKELDDERVEINDLADQLNELSQRINSIGEKGNELIDEYNNRVYQFNDSFVHDHEFTQGDYRSREINIYTFSDERELVLVLAHELGHALSLGHVENEASVMYYLMGEQSTPLTLTEEDRQSFEETCSDSWFGVLLNPLKVLYNSLINR